jgi:hypothetical protein
MKKRITLLSAAAMLALSVDGIAQTVWQEGFESTADSSLPAGWMQTSSTTNAWKTGANTFLSSASFEVPAHTKFLGVNDDKQGASGPTANNSNDLVASPTISGVPAGSFLAFDIYYFAGNYNGITESLKLEVSTNGGSSWNVVQTIAGNSVNAWETRYVDLSTYSGMNIQVAFRYSDNNGWLFGANLDNIKVFVPSPKEIAFMGMTPTPGAPSSFEVTGSGVPLGGTVFNQGGTAITGFTVKYQQGSGPIVSDTKSGLNIAPFTSYNFTHATPYSIPSVSHFPLKMWVEMAGDVDHSNDTANTDLTGASFKPTKKLLVEEATGTWCGWCTRGIVYMDSLEKMHGDAVSLVAVHNADPMAESAYDGWMGSQISGYPSVVIDRREIADPSDLFTVYNAEKSFFGFADITLGAPTVTGTSYSLTATVKPAVDFSGDYRLVCVLAENDVHGTSAGWEQHNYYSFQSQNQPLVGAGKNWQQLPEVVPATTMIYDFVGRRALPSVTGAAGSLPATMVHDQTYTYTFNTTLDASWKSSALNAVVMLIRSSDGAVLNSNSKRVTVGVNNVNAGITAMKVYPNPATDVATVAFSLESASTVNVQLVDAVGRVVYTTQQQMTAGAQQVAINTGNVSSGLYSVKVQTEKGSQALTLSVAK